MPVLNTEGRQQLGRQWRVEIIGDPDLPSPAPGRRSRGSLPSGTNRARGFPSLAIIISSPAAACSTRCDSFVFAL
jgi:hypothetical protein